MTYAVSRSCIMGWQMDHMSTGAVCQGASNGNFRRYQKPVAKDKQKLWIVYYIIISYRWGVHIVSFIFFVFTLLGLPCWLNLKHLYGRNVGRKSQELLKWFSLGLKKTTLGRGKWWNLQWIYLGLKPGQWNRSVSSISTRTSVPSKSWSVVPQHGAILRQVIIVCANGSYYKDPPFWGCDGRFWVVKIYRLNQALMGCVFVMVDLYKENHILICWVWWLGIENVEYHYREFI